MKLDDNGRCCGRKPMVYKSAWSTSTGPHRYCSRCDRAYDLEENEQIPNWAWREAPDGTWERNTNKMTPPAVCLHCGQPRTSHGRFARCSDGETQWEEKP